MSVKEEQLLHHIPAHIMTTDVLHLLSTNVISSAYFGLLKTLTNFTDEIVSAWLNINVKTFRTYKSAAPKTAVKADLQEHLILLLALMKHGIEVFGSKDQFLKWLTTENFHLGKKQPSEFLNTISGIRFVDNRLIGMEYGDNA